MKEKIIKTKAQCPKTFEMAFGVREIAEKCKKCFWYFSIRDHRGKVWGRACNHAIDGLLDGQDIQPTEDCFEARKRRQKPEIEMKDFREILKDLSTKQR